MMENSVRFGRFSCKYYAKIVYNLIDLDVNMMEFRVQFIRFRSKCDGKIE